MSFSTPISIVRLIVAVSELDAGKLFDPAVGRGVVESFAAEGY
ncbi:MAG: hypothetical protein ACPGVO_21650 [Spirulinaceae cyanobacterium]